MESPQEPMSAHQHPVNLSKQTNFKIQLSKEKATLVNVTGDKCNIYCKLMGQPGNSAGRFRCNIIKYTIPCNIR